MDPNGKVALISGGAMGIGQAYARILLENGAKIVLCDIDAATGEKATQDLNTEFGANRVTFFKGDYTSTVLSLCTEVFKKTVATYGGLHILINNAGILDDGRWELEIAINVTAVAQGTLFALKYMDKAQGGVVVNIASILGLQPFPGAPIYAATKHAVDPFHFDRTGVRVVTMCPGVTDTSLISEAHNRQLNAEWNKRCGDDLAALPAQKPINVAKGMLHLIREAPNGSVWVAEGGEPVYRVIIPDRRTLRA
ncbi:UNVERIFIED_CONTAM: hypothetical protein B566_EDAN019194 [Ephemera danica]|nr:hypothetical protein B566_EDAN019194 [Ephemera danica]